MWNKGPWLDVSSSSGTNMLCGPGQGNLLSGSGLPHLEPEGLRLDHQFPKQLPWTAMSVGANLTVLHEDKTFHCQITSVVFHHLLLFALQVFILDTYSSGCWMSHPESPFQTEALISPVAVAFWGLITEFFPRNCPQIKGSASIKGMPLLGGNLHPVTGSCKDSKVWSSCLKSDISEGPGQLPRLCGIIWRICCDCSLAQLLLCPILLPLLVYRCCS